MNPKYKTYTELAAAFKSGELTKHHYLMLDKDGCENILCYYNPDESDAVNDAKRADCGKLFHGDRPIEELFEALDIPCQWC